MPTNNLSSTARPAGWALAAGALVFAVLATLNSGGYRYGVSDQAFYIPAILHDLDPSLFPRDWAMLGAQGRFFLVDEIFGALVRASGWPLPVWFALAQVATLGALYAGAVRLGRACLATPWALVAWLAALTLRHRIAKTGVNTLEPYFHPRMLVFGLGLIAVADLMRGRRWRPLLLVLASGALHPTTAALFLVILVVALGVADPRLRRPVVVAAGLGAAGGVAAVLLGAAPVDLTPMDAPWRALVATKDYTFPTRWSLGTWMVNLLAPAVLIATALARHRDGRLERGERGLVAGCLVLLAGFLLSLPFIAVGVPPAVQLQTSRAFWPVEVLATLSLIRLVAEPRSATGRGGWRGPALAAILVTASAARGFYVGFLESPGRATIALDLPHDDWTEALRWVRDHTPRDAFVLADPGHAWKAGMGTAVRIAGARDVLLEDTKDVAMALYSREVAHRVIARIDAAALYSRLDTAGVQALAAREGLTHVVSDRDFALPRLFEAGSIRIYRLGP